MRDEVFIERYANLNARQKEAVDTIEGPVMVIAGPGTGKTSILTLRIANILRKTDTPADGILALTFTDAGVRAMRGKLREIIGTRADEVRIHTFHSFASSVINEFDDHFPHLAKAKQMTEIEAEQLVREILKDPLFTKLRPLGDPDHYIVKILKTIQECKKEAWTPEMIKSFAQEEEERIKNDENSISSRGASKGSLKADALMRIEKCQKTILFAEVYGQYEDKKRQEKKIDYDDLIIELLLALRTDELLLRSLQERFLYLLVDEHQDTNDSQNQLVSMLADFFDAPNLFVVGDEKQAIYRFQGASVENFLRFQDTWKFMKTIKLEDNYRSHQSLLDASFSLIERNYAEDEHQNLRVRLKAGNSLVARKIEVVKAGNFNAARKYLADAVREIESNSPESSIAVIVRTNREVEDVMSVFEAEGIEASAERGADIFSHPAGVIFFELLEFLHDPSRTDSLAYTIAGGLWELDFGNRISLIKDIKSGKLERLEDEVPALREIRGVMSSDSPLAAIISIADASSFTKTISQNMISSEVWRGIVALSQDIILKGKIEDSRVLIEELLSYKAYAESKSVKIFSGPEGARVRVMTAHGSKGLEFDYVFIPNALEEIWLSRPKGRSFILPRENDDSQGLNDARRLFYVALTRAKKHAIIISPVADDLGKSFTPVRFIDELDAKHVEFKELEPQSLLMVKKPKTVQDRNKEQIKEYAKHMLKEKGLSVTALNHYLKCPAEFIYKSILKLPEAPSASSEKGNAMHLAIAKVWSSQPVSINESCELMEASIKDYFSSSALPFVERMSAEKELLESVPAVASDLGAHFKSGGQVAVETWVEVSFEMKIGQENISIKLHGKLDALIDEGEKVSVFDYKTRSKMSLAEIKGDTQNSDGNYFRQLVFYKLLLTGSSKYGKKRSETSLVFVKPDNKDRCHIVTLDVSDDDMEKARREIENLLRDVWSGEIIHSKCDDKKCRWCGLLQ